MWKETPDCRKHKFCPLTEKRKEHTLYLIFDYHEGGDELPMENGRYMTADMAQNILMYEMNEAASLNKEKILAVLKGGDPLDRFEELKELCGRAWEAGRDYNMDVRFEMTVRPENVTGEVLDWYVKNPRGLSLWIRCEEYSRDIAEFAVRFRCGVLYCMDLNQPERVVSELTELKNAGINVRIQVNIPAGDWTKDTLKKYEAVVYRLMDELPEPHTFIWTEELLRLIKSRQETEGNGTGGRCYDPNGWSWICPELSLLNLYAWDMEDEKLREKEKQNRDEALMWTCPGEMLKWGENSGLLMKKRLLENTFGAGAAAGMKDESINEALREFTEEIR